MTSVQSDITIVDDGGPIAVIELKNSHNLTAEDAKSVRRSVLSYSRVPNADFFLVISQEKGYLWRQKRRDDLDSLPDVEFSMGEVLTRYYSPLVLDEWLRETELKTLVFHWLIELANGADTDNGARSEPLENAGFTKAIRGALPTMDTSS